MLGKAFSRPKRPDLEPKAAIRADFTAIYGMNSSKKALDLVVRPSKWPKRLESVLLQPQVRHGDQTLFVSNLRRLSPRSKHSRPFPELLPGERSHLGAQWLNCNRKQLLDS